MSLLARVPGTAAWRRRREMALCMRTYQRVQELVDGEVADEPDCQQLLRHLDKCVRCGAEAEAIEELKHAVERVCCEDAQELADRMGPVVDRLLREGLQDEDR